MFSLQSANKSYLKQIDIEIREYSHQVIQHHCSAIYLHAHINSALMGVGWGTVRRFKQSACSNKLPRGSRALLADAASHGTVFDMDFRLA